MKTRFFETASVSLLALALAGCGGQETKTDSSSTTPQAPVSERAVAAVTNTLKTAAETTKAVADTAQTVTTKFNETITQAESLLANAKLPEALTSLDSLKGLALSAEQTGKLTAIRTRIEQAIAVAKSAGTEVTKAVSDTTKAASQAASVVSAKVTEAVAQAQTQFKAGKYQDALASLKPLADLKLDASQDKLVADLKAQIEKAIAATKAVGGEASKAVGDLFNKK